MIFRVHGFDKNASKASIDVECTSESVARYTASRHGFTTTTTVEIIDADQACDPVQPAKSSAIPLAWNQTRLPDVLVLASGIFLGLTAFFLFMLIFSWIFGSIRLG